MATVSGAKVRPWIATEKVTTTNVAARISGRCGPCGTMSARASDKAPCRPPQVSVAVAPAGVPEAGAVFVSDAAFGAIRLVK